jgi:hypothetical protein
MKIIVTEIDHSSQLYNTVGNYAMDIEKCLHISISKMSNPLYFWPILLHELTEIAIVLFTGISFFAIDAFDIKYEEDREKGLHEDWEEPGDDKNSPYHQAHCFATAVERMICAILGLSWQDYNLECMMIPYNPKR